MNSIHSVLDHNAGVLLERGAHTRTLCNLAKLFGLTGLAAGAISIGTGNINPGAAAATLGAVMYVGAVGKELDTTGKVLPFPFFSTDIGAIARSAGIEGEQIDQLTEVDWLSNSERAKLAMATTLKPLTVALDTLPEGEQASAYHMLVNGLQMLYPDVIKNVAIMPALLPEMGGLRGVKTQLSQTLPPAHRGLFEASKLPVIEAQPEMPALPPKTPEPPAQYVPMKNREPEAINVTAKTLDRTLATSQTLSLTAYKSLQESPFTSRAWFGGQRTGKSYLAAVASKALSEKNGTRVFHINLASYGDEDSYYWSHVGAWDSVCCDISSMDIPTAKQRIADAIQLVNDFYATENALLVIDEYAYIGGKNNRHIDALAPLLHVIADKIATLASTGIKRRKALWALCPEYVAGAMVKDALAIKKLSLVFCAIAPGHKACWKDSAGQPHELSFDWSLHSMVSNNFVIDQPPSFSEHARLVYTGGQWLSVGLTGQELKAPKAAIA